MPENMPDQPQFPVLRRGGVDPEAVDRHLRDVHQFFEQRVAAAQARYSNLEIELGEARKREEAVHLTLVAATKTKEELLVNAQRDADEMIANSREQSESLLAEAKKEAFRVVSDARQSAEEATGTVRAEAEQIKADAEATAEATRDTARREAIEMINTVESDTAALMAAQEAAIADMRRKYEEEEAELAARVEVLRATAADLEARLKAIATGSLGQTTNLVAEAPRPAVAPAPAPIAPPQEAVAPAPPADVRAATTVEEHVAAAAPVTAPEPPTVAPKARMTQPDVAYVEASNPAAVAAAFDDSEPFDEVAESVEPEIESSDEGAAEDLPVREEVSEVVEPVAALGEIEQIEVVEPAEDTAPEDDAPEDIATEHTAPEEIAAEVAEDPEPEREEELVAAAAVRTPSSRPYGEAEEVGGRKGSYYSRRSAKLPRIGNEAGRSALAAAQAIRGATRGTPNDSADRNAKTA